MRKRQLRLDGDRFVGVRHPVLRRGVISNIEGVVGA
jgi:hypothetical protein